MDKQVTHTDKVPPARVPLSQAIKAEGWIFASGQLGNDPRSRRLAEGGVGPETRVYEVDVSDPEDVTALAAELDGQGEPWGLVHLVGGFHDGDPFDGLDLEAWDRQIALNLRSLAVVLAGFMPGMVRRGGGRVVAVGTRVALRP